MDKKILRIPLDKIRVTSNNRLDLPDLDPKHYFCSNDFCCNACWCIYQRLYRDYLASLGVIDSKIIVDIDNRFGKSLTCTSDIKNTISDCFSSRLCLYDIENWTEIDYKCELGHIINLYKLCE